VSSELHNFPVQIELAAHALAFLVGLPFLVLLLRHFHRQRGLGATLDGAWPDVCWGRSDNGFLALAGLVVLQTVVGMLVGNFLKPDVDKFTEPARYALGLSLDMVANWLIVCGLSLFILRRWRRASFAAFGLTWQRLPAALAIAVKTLPAVLPLTSVLTLSAALLYALLVHHAPPEHPILKAVETRPSAADGTLLFVLTVLVIPFFEELFFRGLIQTTLMRLGRPGIAILISALMFGLAHWSEPTSVPPVIVLGLALGYVFYRTRSLAASYTLHGLFNLLNMSLAILPELLRPAT
jgi:membrane protease YdiL (CAAX protease family)